MDEELQNATVKVYENLGLDLSTAIKMFLKRSVLANGVPFTMTLPKKNYKAERTSEQCKNCAKNLNGTAFIIRLLKKLTQKFFSHEMRSEFKNK